VIIDEEAGFVVVLNSPVVLWVFYSPSPIILLVKDHGQQLSDRNKYVYCAQEI
jgi:hypothetical protein